MSLTMFDVGNSTPCNCAGAPTYPVTIRGCNSALLTGYAIDVYNHSGGSLLYSLTTNGSGVILLPVGTFWVQGHDGRMAGANVTVTTGGGAATLSAATGYYCIGCCPVAFPATLTLTDSYTGFSGNIVWNAPDSQWESAPWAYGYPGCGGCAAKSVNLTFTLRTAGASCVSETELGLVGSCPDNAGVFQDVGGVAMCIPISCSPVNLSATRAGFFMFGDGCLSVTTTRTITG